MELTVVKATDELTQVALIGRLDLAGVQKIEINFLQNTSARKKPTIVDLSGVTFMASLGMRMLLTSAKTLRTANAKLVLMNPQPMVDDMLKAAGIDKVMPLAHDEATALQLVKS